MYIHKKDIKKYGGYGPEIFVCEDNDNTIIVEDGLKSNINNNEFFEYVIKPVKKLLSTKMHLPDKFYTLD